MISVPSLVPPGSPPPHVPFPVPIVIQQIGKTGIDVLWIAFVIYVLATLFMGILARRHERRHRVFHLLLIFVTVFASLSYYAMATNSGYKYVDLGTFTRDGKRVEIIRQISWVRYVYWTVTTPLIFLCLSLLAGLPWLEIIALFAANVALIFTMAFSAFHRHYKSAAKWGWFIFAAIFLLYIFKEILYTGFKAGRNRHASLYKLYAPLAVYIAILWVLYPITFIVSQQTGLISVNWEVIIFTILDLLSTVGFGLWLLLAYRPARDDEYAAALPDCFVDERGTSRGPIQLPVS